MGQLILRSTVDDSEPATFDFYIGPSGSDSNDGLTTGTPWALTAINTKASTYDGLRVGLLDGTYDVSGVSTLTGGQDNLFTIASGSVGSPTVIKAVNARSAIIKGNNGGSYPHNDCGLLGNVSNAGYVTIDGLKFTGGGALYLILGNPGNQSDAGTRSPGYIVQNCEFTGLDAEASGASPTGNIGCIKAYATSSALYANNWFHDNIGAEGADNNGHFSDVIGFHCDDTVFEYCDCEDSSGFYGKASSCVNTTIRYCYLNMDGFATDSRTLQDWNTGTSGVFLVHNCVVVAPFNDLRPTSGGAGGASTFAWRNNTISISASGASHGLIAVMPAGTASIYNNIFVSVASGDHSFVTINANADGLVDYNLYYHASDPKWGTYAANDSTGGRTAHGSISAWKTAMGGSVDANSPTPANPQFAGSGARALFYQLQGGSPAEDAGKSNGLIGGTICDLGAWGGAAPPSRIGCDFA